jgi:hypothetical protein
VRNVQEVQKNQQRNQENKTKVMRSENGWVVEQTSLNLQRYQLELSVWWLIYN